MVGYIFRGISIAALTGMLGVSALAAHLGLGINRISKDTQQTVRENSTYFAWFRGGGYREGK